MKKHNGGPAFPVGDQLSQPQMLGMSLRDYFATHTPIPLSAGKAWSEEAAIRYEYADAMIAARGK